MLLILTHQWDDEILAELDIPKCILPKPKPSSCVYGEQILLILVGPFPLQVLQVISSQHYSDRPVLNRGARKNTYGTGCFLLMNTGEKPIFSENGLVTTIAWGMDGKVNYALEGSIFVAGAAIQWLRDELKLIDSAPIQNIWLKR